MKNGKRNDVFIDQNIVNSIRANFEAILYIYILFLIEA